MYMRRPRTLAETRVAVAAAVEDETPRLRAKRGNLPDAWDDMITHRDRSWKSYRLTRYRA